MTDTLRTKIAAVLGEHWAGASGYDCKCGWKTAPLRALSDDYEKHLADAVIRELKQQWRADYGYDGYQKCETRDEAAERVADFNAALGDDWQDGEQAMVMTRYVTEWEDG